ncbi:DUF1850 domain-containing protein [Mangrovibrevibacter kandeliae]|uniref:DUF1850 domain-containing protein n=1 Tax=Mangrovibrevibacter kandeliae TaxID=2968473 RepID=UPI0021174A99|nr:DUF1850 domain-containing protein [Aurantimonas sp. CSK15Z-1]MCQ8782270.1 DUF1850 domain-containing protein [Aurantimonas sp. CSK15Z-1]
MICIATGGKLITLAATAFTLSWTHSVEKTRWEEHWSAGPEGLTVVEGRIEGSGAGMDPPPDAVLKDGAYVYHPHVPPLPELVLAASGATVGGWTLCVEGGRCLTLGDKAGAAVKLRWCPAAVREGG